MMRNLELKTLIKVVISLIPEFNEDRKNNPKLKKKTNVYFKAAESFLKAGYGDVTISRTDNFVETTPHFHFLVVPKRTEKSKKGE